MDITRSTGGLVLTQTYDHSEGVVLDTSFQLAESEHRVTVAGITCKNVEPLRHRVEGAPLVPRVLSFLPGERVFPMGRKSFPEARQPPPQAERSSPAIIEGGRSTVRRVPRVASATGLAWRCGGT